MDYKEKFSIRLKRHKDFFSSNQPGDILFCRGGSNFFPSFQHHWLNILQKRTLESIKKEDVIKINDDYLKQLRARYQEYYNIDDDGIPTIEVYFGIGAVTSAMSGKQPAFLSGRSWCGHILQRREDADILKFDYNNIILQLHLMVYQNMVDRWQGDYLLTPFMYRSPLDAAWGLRGNDLFYDFYDYPDFVKQLANWCADWSIQTESFFSENTKIPNDLERGVWNAWLPERCIFVNGDPVDIISDKFQQEFDRPFNEKLFRLTGGGFFHHHSLGLKKVTNISKTQGMILHNIDKDINEPDPFYVLLSNAEMRKKILKSSMKCPIHLKVDDDYFYRHLDNLLPILKKGRFIIRYFGNDGRFEEVIKKIKS